LRGLFVIVIVTPRPLAGPSLIAIEGDYPKR
jgi:hypothetical protein